MTRHRPANAYEDVAAARGAGKSAAMAAGAMLALAAMSPWAWSATPELVSATCLGGPGADLAEGVAIAPDGTIYVVGAMAEPIGDLPGGLRPTTLGSVVEGSPYGCGFIARFSADGRKLLSYTQFAPGVAKLTTVELAAPIAAGAPAGRTSTLPAGGKIALYVGGYATEGLEPLIAGLGGLVVKFPGSRRMPPRYTPREHTERSNRQPDRSTYGVPFVAAFGADPGSLERGTYLEGRHTVWHVPMPLDEDHWQPTGIAVLSGGDVVVCHDGGPCADPRPGQSPGLEEFYYCPDHLSRLSADLSGRAWKRDIYLHPVDRAKASKATGIDWKHDTLGNCRSFRLRPDGKDNLYLAGWSCSRTSKEPWWCPFLLKYGPDGQVVWRAYTFDPMSGGGDRLGGLVSDAAVRTVAIDGNDNVLAAGIGDGGNNVLRGDPRDYTRSAKALKGSVSSFHGRVLFFGTVVRLDGQTRELLGGNHVGGHQEASFRAAWANDLSAAPGGRVLAVGRHTQGFHFTDDAWFRGDVGSFVRLYSADFDEIFSTSIPDSDLLAVARKGTRFAVAGSARSARTPVKPSSAGKFAGATDAYLLVVDCAR